MKHIWKNVKEKVITSWRILDGKKTIIGGILVLTAKGGQAFFPELLSPLQYEFVEYVGEGIIGLGLGHKALKTKVVNDAIKRAQNSVNKKGNTPK